MSTPYRAPRPRATEPAKGLAIASLVLGILGLPTLGLLFVGSLTGLVLGIIALTRTNREPHIYGGKGIAIGGIVTNALSVVLVPVIGIIAAIAIPSLLRARVSANEARAIGDIRTVISAQHTYAQSNGGFFDTLECLASPRECLPNYRDGAPDFLDAQMVASPQRTGYNRTFHAGAAAEESSQISPSSLMSFAYVAVPITQGTTGFRAFCGDSTGRICATRDGREPEVELGLCARSCEDLP